MSRHLPSLKQMTRQMELEYLTLLSELPEATPEIKERIRHMKARIRLGDDAYLRWLLREARKKG